ERRFGETFATGAEKIMHAGAGADSSRVYRSGDEDATKIQELYGLAFRLLPPALVMALTEPLLLVPEPAAPPRIVFPAKVPSFWHHRPLGVGKSALMACETRGRGRNKRSPR